MQRGATRVVKKRGSGLDRLLCLLVRVLWRESLNDSAVVPHATYTEARRRVGPVVTSLGFFLLLCCGGALRVLLFW